MSEVKGGIERVLSRLPKGDASVLVHAMQDVQTEFNYLPADAVKAVAEHLGVPFSKAYAVATFYKAFSLTPRGKTILKCCTGTTCHIRGSSVVIEDLRKGLGVGPGETTPDMAYTVEAVNCVGACALAPVVIAGDRYMANLKPGEVMKRLKEG